MMTLAQAQAIALALMESELQRELSRKKPDGLWAYELRQAIKTLENNRQTRLEQRKLTARRLLQTTSLSFSEIGRQSNLSHETVRLMWNNLQRNCK